MNSDLALALSLADDADAISMRHYRTRELAVETKADLTPVTEGDRAVEQALRTRLERERPGEAIAGEEYGVAEGDVRWWLDPIDGTKQYARGIPIWATLIALERGGEAVVAVVSAPALGQRWWAVCGEGAFLAGEPIRVSSVDALANAYVSTTSIRDFPAFAQLASQVALARTYPDFWHYMLVAEGRIEAGIDTAMAPWDIPAPRLIVEEAGGRFSEEPGLYLASNGVLHEELRAALGASAEGA
ncbi:MAG: histidinol-phosphatase [Gaiellaceae bacterium]|nr:histidinol-phosphatase [Gaiellaceae bacterium]